MKVYSPLTALRAGPAVSLAALLATFPLVCVDAHAGGTAAGTVIDLQYTAGYTYQGSTITSDSFTAQIKVGKVINLVSELNPSAADHTGLIPGKTNAVIKASVTNTSNTPIDVLLSTSQSDNNLVADIGAPGVDDDFVPNSFNVTNLRIYIDDGDGLFDPAKDVVAVGIDNLAVDAKKTVWIAADIPSTTKNLDFAVLTFSAQAVEFQGAGLTSPAAITQVLSSSLTAGDAVILADAAGKTDAARDGIYTLNTYFSVSSATLSSTWYQRVVSDPVNGISNPKAVPGAFIEYCMAVTNAQNAAEATNLAIKVPIPTTLNP